MQELIHRPAPAVSGGQTIPEAALAAIARAGIDGIAEAAGLLAQTPGA